MKLQHAEDMPLAVLKKVKRDPENNTDLNFTTKKKATAPKKKKNERPLF